MLSADIGMLTALGMLNFSFCELFRLHLNFFFFLRFSRAFFALLNFLFGFLVFLTWDTESCQNLHLAEWCHWYAGASIRTVDRFQRWRAPVLEKFLYIQL